MHFFFLTARAVFRMSFCHAGFKQVGHELLSANASLMHSRQNVWPQGRLYESRRKPSLRRCVGAREAGGRGVVHGCT